MKAKRFLAALLCMVMVFGDTSLVRAAQVADVAPIAIEASDEDSSSVVVAPELEANVSENIETETETLVEVLPGDEDGVVLIEENNATVSEEPVIVDDEIIGDVEALSDFFTVDADGTLRKKDPSAHVPYSTVEIPATIEVDGVDVYVKTIPAGVFTNDRYVKTVTFAEGSRVTEIYSNAFSDSTLEEIKYPSPVTDPETNVKYEITKISANTFKNSSLKRIQFNGCNIDTIGRSAFQSSKLVSFTAPNGLKKIDESAFAGCSELQSAVVTGVEEIGEEAFINCIALGSDSANAPIEGLSSLRKLGNRAFKSSGLVTFDMTSAALLTDVGVEIFGDCKNLKTVFTPNNIPMITARMFMGCEKLTKVQIGNVDYPSTTIIDVEAFEGCTSLYEIVLPASVREIRSKAFNECAKIGQVDILLWDEDLVIAKDAFPPIGTKLTLRGYSKTLENFCADKGYKFFDLWDREDIVTKFGNNAKVVLSTQDKASNLRPKRFEKVTIAITPKQGYTLFPENGRFISATEYDGNKVARVFTDEELEFKFESCDNGVIKFSFYMPMLKKDKNRFELSGVVDDEKKYAADEKSLIIDVTDRTNCTFKDGNPAELVFEETGNQTQLVFKDAKSRKMGPWRFEFSVPESSDVVRVTPDGTVTARNFVKNSGVVNAKLKSSGTIFPINVKVKNGIIVNKMRFNFSEYDLSYVQPAKLRSGFEQKTEIEVVNEGKDDEYTRVVTKEYQYVEIPKSTVTAAQRKKQKVQIKVQAQANYELDATGRVKSYKTVDTNWISGETGVAKPILATSYDGYNLIDIPYTSVGEALLTVTVNNPTAPEEKDRVFTTGLLVKIIDDTPRLISGILTINANDELGTKLPLLTVDEYPIDGNNLFFSSNKDASNKDNNLDFEITFKDGEYYAKASPSLRNRMAPNEIKTFNNLYIKGEVGAEPFALPVGVVYVEKKELLSTIGLRGSINLFYKTTNGLDPKRLNSGRVMVDQGLTYEKVEKYELYSIENHENKQNQRPLVFDDLANNFSIRVFDRNIGNAEITRTDNELRMEKDNPTKVVTSGYLYTYYEGYVNPVITKVNIPTVYKAPSYRFNVEQKTAHVAQSRQVYQLMLFDKATATLPVLSEKNKYDEIVKSYDNVLDGAIVSLDESDATTRKLIDKSQLKIVKVEDEEFADPNDSKKKIKISVNKVNIQLAGTPVSGKAVFNIQCKNWEKPVKYTLTIKAVKNDAKTKIKNPTITLNTAAGTMSGEITINLDQDFAEYEAPLLGKDLTVKCKTDLLGSAEILQKNLTIERISVNGIENNGALVKVNIPKTGGVEPGTYNFEFKPRIKYTDEYSVTLKQFTRFKVVVTNKVPKLKLKSPNIVLNGLYPGTEVIKNTFTMQNMPVGDYEIDFSKAEITSLSKPKNEDDADNMEYVRKHLAVKFIDKVDTEELKEPAYVSVGFIPGTKRFINKFNYKYQIDKVYAIKDGVKTPEPIDPVVIQVSIKLNEPKVNQSAKGTINTVDPLSNTVYTIKVQNINSKVISANLIELDDNNVPVSKADQHFTVKVITQEDYENDDLGYRQLPNITIKNKKVVDNQVLLQWNDKEIEKNKKYKIRLEIDLEAREVGTLETKIINVSPRQSIPGVKPLVIKPVKSKLSKLPTTGLSNEEIAALNAQLKAEQENASSTAVIYSYSKNNQQIITRVTPTSVKSAKVSEVRLKTGTSLAERNIKRAFEMNYYKVSPDKNDRSTYYVYDVKDNCITVTFDDDNKISVNKVGVSTFTGVKPADVDSFVTELVNEERNYRSYYIDDEKYFKNIDHYYIKTDLLNPSLVPKNKPFSLNVEVRYKNQFIKTNGSIFKIAVTVK